VAYIPLSFIALSSCFIISELICNENDNHSTITEEQNKSLSIVAIYCFINGEISQFFKQAVVTVIS
jgi:hypothetical protein